MKVYPAGLKIFLIKLASSYLELLTRRTVVFISLKKTVVTAPRVYSLLGNGESHT